MIDQVTINKLHEMKLSSMAEAFRNQMQDQSYDGLTFQERFGLIVDMEWSKRKNNRLARLIQNAGFSETGACLENIEYSADRKLDKSQISSLATCNYIQEKHGYSDAAEPQFRSMVSQCSGNCGATAPVMRAT